MTYVKHGIYSLGYGLSNQKIIGFKDGEIEKNGGLENITALMHNIRNLTPTIECQVGKVLYQTNQLDPAFRCVYREGDKFIQHRLADFPMVNK